MITGQKYFSEHYQLEVETQHETSCLKRNWVVVSVGDSPDEALYRHREQTRIQDTAHLYRNKSFRMVKCRVEKETIWHLDNEARKDVTTIAVV